MKQSLTILDGISILGTLLLYDTLKWYYREFKKRKERMPSMRLTMTKAELETAIEFFDESLKKQRNSIVERGFYGEEVPEEDGRALAATFTALACLREALERAKGCAMCKGKTVNGVFVKEADLNGD